MDKLRNKTEMKLITASKITRKFIKNNSDVLFTRADKGNTVLVLDRTDYISKMEESLSDINTYTLL